MVKQADEQFTSFEECPTEKNRLHELVTAMQELQSQLKQAQNEYKEQLKRCLTNKHPFPTSQDLEKDVSQFIKLISYCLYVGDMDILMEWGIYPVKKDNSLLASVDFELYKLTFEEFAQDSENELEKKCFLELTDFFDNLVNKTS